MVVSEISFFKRVQNSTCLLRFSVLKRKTRAVFFHSKWGEKGGIWRAEIALLYIKDE